MPFARLCLLTTFLCTLPVVALAQTAASPTAATPAAAPSVPLTQDATVTEPNMNALTPATPTASGKPRWSEFPTAPKNVPKAVDFAVRVHKEEADSALVDSIGRAIVWEAYQADALTADANARLDPAKLMPIDPELTPAQTDALAQSLRQQDTPPPIAQ